MKVQGKIVVVTGGLSGLGLATVSKLTSIGAHVAVLDLTLPEETESNNSALKYFKVDVSSEAEVAKAAQDVASWSQATRMDIGAIICCAGYLGSQKILSKSGSILSLEKFKKVLDVSLTGTVDIIRHLLPYITKQQPDQDGERGVIVTVASAAAFDGQEGQLAYSAAKGGIASMTLPLARDLARWGVRAVCIAPGMFGTNMVAGMPDKVKESLQKSLEFPSRPGKADEFADLVEHLLYNRMFNGSVLRLDGAARMPSRL